jgi:hypothetical protein
MKKKMPPPFLSYWSYWKTFHCDEKNRNCSFGTILSLPIVLHPKTWQWLCRFFLCVWKSSFVLPPNEWLLLGMLSPNVIPTLGLLRKQTNKNLSSSRNQNINTQSGCNIRVCVCVWDVRECGWVCGYVYVSFQITKPIRTNEREENPFKLTEKGIIVKAITWEKILNDFFIKLNV